jgi:hypothetical protein
MHYWAVRACIDVTKINAPGSHIQGPIFSSTRQEGTRRIISVDNGISSRSWSIYPVGSSRPSGLRQQYTQATVCTAGRICTN